MTEGENRNPSRTEWITLVVVLVLSLVIRLYDLGTKDIWYDESLSLLKGLFSLKIILKDSMSQIAPDAHPLLYPLFLFLWMKLGAGEFMVRLPSALAGTATVYCVYMMARALFGGRVALISSICAGLSPFLVAYSQEARNYIFHCLFTLASLYSFWRFMEEENGRDEIRWALCYGILTWLNMNTHYFSFFFIAFENVFFFLSKWGRLPKIRLWCCIQAGLLIWLLIMMPLILIQRSLVMSHCMNDWNPSVTPHNIMMLFLNWNFTVLQLHGNAAYPWINRDWGITAVLILLIAGSIRALREGRKGLFILGWFYFPLIAAVLVSLHRSILVDRYYIAILPALFILIALAVDSFKPKSVGIVSLCLIVLLYGSALFQYYGKYTLPGYRGFFLQSLKGLKDFRGTTAYLNTHLKNDDVIMVDESFIFMPLLYYNYSARRQIRYAATPDPIRREREARRIILIHSVPPLPENMVPTWEAGKVAPAILKELESYGSMVDRVSVKGIDIYVFQKKSPQ